MIETADNGEFVTVTSFQLTPCDIIELLKKYQLEAVDGNFIPGFAGHPFLIGPKPADSDLNKCSMKIEQKGKATAVYVIDTSRRVCGLKSTILIGVKIDIWRLP